MLKIATLSVLIVFILIKPINVFSEEDKKFPSADNIGVGFSLFAGGGTAGDPLNFGATVAKVLDRDMHAGANVGLTLSQGGKDISIAMSLRISPYIKYFFDTKRSLRPYGIGGLSFTSKFVIPPGELKSNLILHSSLFLGCGAEWFPYSSVGVYGGLKVLDIKVIDSKLSNENNHYNPGEPIPPSIIFGLGETFIGIEWFL